MSQDSRLPSGRLHFAGIGGSGMSALAQFQALRGGLASGSDRSFDRGERLEAQAQLRALGIALHPQDGSGVPGTAALVVSTAVEATVPDVAAAQSLGLPILHRSDVLAAWVASHRTVAVTGTSGKSTTTAMVFELLQGAGRSPSVLTGGDLRALQCQGAWGNAAVGQSDLLVVEADESDGTVVRYAPAVGILLNLQRDHKEPEVVAELFRTFRAQCREGLVVGDDPALTEFRSGALVTGLGPDATLRATDLDLQPRESAFTMEGTRFRLPLPGQHNVENALAALGACRLLGIPLQALVEPLAHFQGVARRFQTLGEVRGITVVDDFGHNPAKIRASLRTAQACATRVLALFQPHGFGPLAFMRDELIGMLQATLRPQDRWFMTEVFYAGGTVQRTVTSDAVAARLQDAGLPAQVLPRANAAEHLAQLAQPGDLILVMGARDPSLTQVAASLLGRLGS